MSGIASLTPTRNALACESSAVSHCSRLMSSGGLKKAGTSGRALLTKTSSLPSSAFTLANIRRISSGFVTSACTSRPSEPRFRTAASVSLAAASFW